MTAWAVYYKPCLSLYVSIRTKLIEVCAVCTCVWGWGCGTKDYELIISWKSGSLSLSLLSLSPPPPPPPPFPSPSPLSLSLSFFSDMVYRYYSPFPLSPSSLTQTQPAMSLTIRLTSLSERLSPGSSSSHSSSLSTS